MLALLLAGGTTLAAAAPTVEIDSARFGNLFELGATPVLRITVAADAADALRGRLEVAATDAYRGRAGQAAFRVDLVPGATASFELPLVSRRPLGHFTISARLRNARGRTLVRHESTAAIVPPVEPSDAEDSAVGYFVFPDPAELPRAAEIADQKRRLGIRWVRLTFNWWADARTDRPDTSDPAWIDSAVYERWVDAFRASGIEVLGVLFGTARWASSTPADGELAFGIPSWGLVKPQNLEDWLLFGRTLSERLKGKVRNWEVWNEPDTVHFWRSGAEDFAALVRATADMLHEVDPSTRVVVNLLDRGSDRGRRFSDVVLAQAGDTLDVFGLHYAPDDWVADVVRFAPPLLRPHAEIWNTEAWGAPRRQVSRWLAQRAAGVAKLFPFIYHTVLDDEADDSFRLLGLYPVNVDYTPRPDAVAVRTLSDQVGSAVPLAVDDVGLGYQAFTFQADTGPVVALVDRNDLGKTWSGPPGVVLTLRVPSDVRRITVVDLMGNSESVTVRRGRLRLRLFGVAAFLRIEQGASLGGLQIVRVRRGR